MVVDLIHVLLVEDDEDDYVITDKGLQRLSTAPREMDEIEALMKRRARVQP